MGKYIIRRMLQMIPVVLGSTFLIYVMVFALPGDPVQGRCGERPCPPNYIAAFNAEYNLGEDRAQPGGIGHGPRRMGAQPRAHQIGSSCLLVPEG